MLSFVLGLGYQVLPDINTITKNYSSFLKPFLGILVNIPYSGYPPNKILKLHNFVHLWFDHILGFDTMLLHPWDTLAIMNYFQYRFVFVVNYFLHHCNSSSAWTHEAATHTEYLFSGTTCKKRMKKKNNFYTFRKPISIEGKHWIQGGQFL